MARLWTGTLATLTKGSSTGGENAVLTGVSATAVPEFVLQRHFKNARFAITVSGKSGSHGCNVVAAIAGATFIIAGTTDQADGTLSITGTSYAMPFRPTYVSFESGIDGCGFVNTVEMVGEY